VKCERIREMVSDALDGVLAGSVADRFHAHLDTCPPCRTYYMELKESLLLLEELPTVEVGDDFDRAVWARIRAEEEPRPAFQSLGERLEMLRVRFSFGTGLLRWSPVAVAGAVLLGVAVTSGPSIPVAVSPAGPETAAAPASDADLEPGASSVRPGGTPEETALASSGFEEQEYVSGMPRAVEHYLEAGRDLRLETPGRYENANYSYPLRQFSDPAYRGGFGRNGRASGFSWNAGPGGLGMPVGDTAPSGPSTSGARVMVLEF